ncbi:MAG TPA: acetyltransferase [Blastocatellia bacterium]|nr:acetyltransferase [Blastocatellia bacterium]
MPEAANNIKVVIIGAGGHAQVVADALLRAREAGIVKAQPIGFLDDNTQLTGKEILGMSVIGSIKLLKEVEHNAVVVAIGDNATRELISNQLQSTGERLLTVRHPSATIAPDVKIGDGVMISAGVIINTGSVIGDNVILNTGCTIDHHNQIGSYVHVAPGVHLAGEVAIGEGTLVGIGATVLPQRRIGARCIIGGGAVVTCNLDDGQLAVGIPARVIKK